MLDYAKVKSLVVMPQKTAQVTHRDGKTEDIISIILKTYNDFNYQVKPIAYLFKGSSTLETAKNIWAFIYHNIKYIEDDNGHQKIKSPSRTIYDRFGDCKSFSVLAGSLLNSLKIPFSFRFVSYEKGSKDVTHVYIIVQNEGKQIVLDACLPYFNLEKSFFYNIDYNMSKISQVNGVGYVPIVFPFDGSPAAAGSAINWTSVLNQALNIGAQFIPKPKYETLQLPPINLQQNPTNFQIPANTPTVNAQGQIIVNGQVVGNTQNQNQSFDISGLLANPLVLGGLALLLFGKDLKKMLG